MLWDLLLKFGAWDWLIGGFILLGLEILVPGAFLLWFGVAAIAVGLLSFAVDISWQMQAVCFAVLAVVLVLAVIRFRRRPAEGDTLFLNERAKRTIGHVYPLVEAITHGVGRIRVGDGSWSVAGPDLPAGALVRVTGHDGTQLTVEAA
jgi:membrane protein implicated in regulation of membrane protease activity